MRLGSSGERQTSTSAAPVDRVALELEHAFGFTGTLQGIAFHPDPTKPVIGYGCGRLIIFTDLGDSHNQRLLRGHDAQVTCVDFSPKGTLFVSGQCAALDSFVYVNVWDLSTMQVKQRIQTPHKGHVDAIRFSPDEGMLATTGAEGMLCIWDAVTGSKVAAYHDTISGDQAKSLCWGEVRNPATRNQQYLLYVAFNTGVRLCTLSFSVKKLNFDLEVKPCQLPGAGGRMGGYQRKYQCCDVLGDAVLCGTCSGDILVFNSTTGLYRTALTLCANGVNAIAALPQYNVVIVGGGDGTLKKITGCDKEWTLLQQVQFEGAVVSMTRSSDEHQLVVMTTAGLIYRVLPKDLTFTVCLEAPLGGLSDVALPQNGRTDIFASCSNDGVLRVWDLNEYAIISMFTLSSNSRCGAVSDVANPTSATFDSHDTNMVICGFTDGRIRGIDFSEMQGKCVWTIPNGHKGIVHTVRTCATYFLTAGQDSCIRIWSRATQGLISQFQEHKRDATSALIDNTTDHIIHTISLDMSLFSYDLTKMDRNPNVAQPRRIATHSDATTGGFTCMSQRVDCEREVVVGTVEGKILFYDLDYPEPVISLSDVTRTMVTSLEVSPTGRFLVAGLGDGSLVVYELFPTQSQAKLVLQATCHSTRVVRCSWTRDGRQIVSAGGDGELILWNFYTANDEQLM